MSGGGAAERPRPHISQPSSVGEGRRAVMSDCLTELTLRQLLYKTDEHLGERSEDSVTSWRANCSVLLLPVTLTPSKAPPPEMFIFLILPDDTAPATGTLSIMGLR